MNLITLALFAFCLIVGMHAQNCNINRGCNVADVADAIQRIQTATNNMKSKEMRKGGGSGDFADVNQELERQFHKISPCLKLVPEVILLDEEDPHNPEPSTFTRNMTMGSGLIGTVSQRAFQIDSKGCEFFNTSSPQWKNDPCCNHELGKCCKKHAIQAEKYEIATFNQVNLDACCGSDANDMSSYLQYWIKTIRQRKKKCQLIADNGFKEVDRLFEGVGKCFRQLFEEQSCDSDDDCDGDSECRNGVCPKSGKSDKNAVSKSFAICLFQLVPSKVKPSIKEKLDVESDNDMYNALAQQISSGQCIKRSEPWVTVTGAQYNTSQKCESAMVCNDGSGGNCANPGQGFCGYECNNNQCQGKYSLGSVPDRATCGDIGYCIATDGWLTKGQCEAQKYCTVQSEMNQQNCTRAHLCKKFPFREPTCLKDGFRGPSGDFQCNEANGWYEERYIRKCRKDSISTEAACNSAGGSWTRPPKTEEDCLRYKRCVDDNGRPNGYNQQDCDDCNGNWGSIFTATPGQWRNKKFIQAGTWLNQTMRKKHAWVESIDQDKIFDFLYRTASKLIVPLIVSSSKCDNEPYFQLVETLACACGQNGGSNCFDFPERSVAEDLKFYRDGSEKSDFGPGSAHPQSYESSSFTTSIKEKSVVPPSSSKRMLSVRGGLATSQVNVVSGSDDSTVGSVVGSGYSASSATSTSTVQLCIAVSSDYSKDASHTVAAFCVQTNSKYYFKSSDVTTDGTEICKTVSSSTTYYPCYVTTGTTDTTGDIGSDSSSGVSMQTFSMGLFVAALFVFNLFM